MHLVPCPLDGLQQVHLTRYEDTRGSFMESWVPEEAASWGMPSWVQENSAVSHYGVLRGLHLQRSPGQAKLVRCTHGKIWDCAVDLRPESPTHGKWWGLILEDAMPSWFYIPVGFAHGYCVLSERAVVDYKVSQRYNAAEERTIRWDDPELAIAWPLQQPILSERDRHAPLLKQLLQEASLCT